MATISRDEVQIIAELAKLTLTEAEIDTFQEQLSDILEYAEMLQQLDTTGVPPTTSALPLKNVMRADVVTLSLDTETALLNAPQAEENSFKVQAVLD